MTFSGCGSYCKGTCDYDGHKAIQYVLNKLEGIMTAFKYYRAWYFCCLQIVLYHTA